MNRKKFLLQSAAGATLLINSLQTFATNLPDIEPYKIELVKEFVVAGHGGKEGDFEKLKSMLNDYPNMIYSKYDWGSGDFESAIEGAGHVGKKEIAEYLLNAGSRVTLFVLCMLGKTNLVKPILEEYPKLAFAKGPHGFTMLHHAKIGGKNSEELFAYLQEKGVKETWIKIK